MRLVNQHDLTIGRTTELVFGVHQNQPGALSDLLPALENRERGGLDLNPGLGIEKILLDNLRASEAFIVSGDAAFRRRRDDRFGQDLVFLQSIGETITVNLALAERIAIPQRGRRHAGDVSAHDHFDRKRFGFNRDKRVRIGHGNLVIRDHVRRLIEPPCRELIEHLPFERHAREDAVKRGESVCRDEQTPVVPERVSIAHFADLLAR